MLPAFSSCTSPELKHLTGSKPNRHVREEACLPRRRSAAKNECYDGVSRSESGQLSQNKTCGESGVALLRVGGLRPSGGANTVVGCWPACRYRSRYTWWQQLRRCSTYACTGRKRQSSPRGGPILDQDDGAKLDKSRRIVAEKSCVSPAWTNRPPSLTFRIAQNE